MSASDWIRFKDALPPRGDMFIWAAHESGKWSLGLGYWTVTEGRWADAYGFQIQDRATHWKPIGPPPEAL
jgi:hypothetical protein